MLKSLKVLWIIPAALFLYSCASAPEEPVEDSNDSGSAVEEKAKSEKELKWVSVTEEEYFVSQETIKYGDGFVDGYRLYEYDDNGRLLTKSQIGSDETVISEEIFIYEDGTLTSSEFYSGNEMISRSSYSYDKNNNLVEESFMNPKGELQGVSSYEYDSSGHRIKWISGDSGGIPMMYTEYEYNDDDVVRMSYFLPTGEMEGYTQLNYGEAGVLEEATYSAASKLEKKTEYVYRDGKVVQALFYYGKNLSRTMEYEYDDKGNVLKLTTFNRNGDITDIVEKEYIVIPVTRQVLQ